MDPDLRMREVRYSLEDRIGWSNDFHTGKTRSISSIPNFAACSAQFPKATAKARWAELHLAALPCSPDGNGRHG
jgi:hypothetical protein